MSMHKTTCLMDCPDTCSLHVTVTEGKVTHLTGTKDHPVTNGFICSKVGRFAKRMYGPDRLLHPMKRVGAKGSGSFEKITWDEAITTITEKFKEVRDTFGGEAILPYYYGGSNGFLSQGFTDALYFARLGASRMDPTICAAPTSATNKALYGGMPGVAFEDFEHARFILVWGCNPKYTSIHLIPQLKKARKNGAFIAVVDPMNHFSSKEIDLHIPVRPGTDLPLALAMIHYWKEQGKLDEDFLAQTALNSETLFAEASKWTLEAAAQTCCIPAGDIQKLADAYANTSPALLRCGWGQERNTNGGQATAAILAMPTLLGKFGVRGGGYTMSNSGAFSVDMSQLLHMPEHQTRLINMTQLAEALEDREQPIKALFVYNNNFMATTPGQGRLMTQMAREDLFTVVSEQVLTDTAVYADIVLPAVTFIESHDIRKAYGAFVVGGIRRVVDPVGESLSNHEVFCRLGKAMGFDDTAFNWSLDDAFENVAAAVRGPDGEISTDALREGRVVRAFGENPIQFKEVFPKTQGGKVDLCPEVLGEAPYQYEDLERDGYPLALISPASGKMVTSTFGEFNYPTLEVTIHPDDANDRGLAQGDIVRVYNELGEVVVPLRISNSICPGTACLPKGAWRKASRNGYTSTALCPTTVNVVAGGACFNDARVEIEAHGS